MYKSDATPILRELSDLIFEGLISGMKVETESEGLAWDEIVSLRILAQAHGLPFLVKIGGAEAITDMKASAQIFVDELIAPMIETKFAAEKFLSAAKDHAPSQKKRLLIESITGIRNIKQICELARGVSGVNFGRSDFVQSLNLETSSSFTVDSREVLHYLNEGIELAKSFGFETTMGGQISGRTVRNLVEMKVSLPDRLETRRFILPTKALVSDPSLIDKILNIELRLMKYQVKNANKRALHSTKYLGELVSRIEIGRERISPV